MIGTIELVKHKALVKCKLEDLGQINVICGKNNSGKSTVLEAMDSKELRSVGCRFSMDEAREILKASVHRIPIGRIDLSLFQDYGAKHLEELCQKTWYESDGDEFAKTACARMKELQYPSYYKFSQKPFVAVFQGLKTVLLPAKRRLELRVQVQSNSTAEPSGVGVANAIFFAKNQDSGTTEFQRLTQLHDAFALISGGAEFDYYLGNKNKISLQFNTGKTWRKAEDCGLGMQDLLTILYFSIISDAQVVLIEEPESHLHAEVQRRLLFYLKSLVDKQFFLSTHSNVFIDLNHIDRVFSTKCEGELLVQDISSRAIALQDLGFSVADNLVCDVLILVEGPYDKKALEVLLRRQEVSTRAQVLIWFLGGDVMDQIDLDVVQQSYKIICLIDQDPGSQTIRERFIRRCAERTIEVCQLNRYSIENYYPVSAYRKVFGGQIGPGLKELDPDKKVEGQIGLDPKRNTLKLAEASDMQELMATDLGDFIMRVNELCDESSQSE